MNAMRRPSTALKIVGAISRYFDVHADEHEALDRQHRRGRDRERRPPVQGARDDERDHTDQFENAEGRPGCPRQRTKDGTSALTLSNMKTFMTPDAP